MGRDRDAGCDCSIGISKTDMLAIPPAPMRAVEMLKILMAFVDIVVCRMGNSRRVIMVGVQCSTW